MEKSFTLNDVAIKARSKKEVYYVLATEGGIYLPPIIDANSSYLKEIARGTKLFLYSKNVKVIKVPQIKKLFVNDILKWGKSKTNIDAYLPTYKYVKFPNREWICNALNTIAYEDFQKYVKEAFRNREKQLVMTKGLDLAAIPKIAKIFSESHNISYEKGRSHFIMRDFKRKWYEIEDDMKVDLQGTNKFDELNLKIKQLEDKVALHAEREEELLKDKEKLVILYENGIIDSDGEAIEK